MAVLNRGRINVIELVVFLISFSAIEAGAQLVYQQKLDKHSAILPLTLDNDVYRVRCKPPEGIEPRDISCDIGITGTVLTDQRGTSSTGTPEKVLADLRHLDNIDVQFTDRVNTDKHDYAGNRVIQKYDFDCGINIKYQNKLKIAQVEIRVGYLLPSGDREGFTWAKLSRKRRQFADNIATCDRCKNEIANLEGERANLQNAGSDNAVQLSLIHARLTGINRMIDRKIKYADRRGEFERDLAAFNSVTEYLKTKLIGTQVYVHFRYKENTLPVDIEDLKRSRIRPIQVFEASKDPIKNRDGSVE
jgi:hypothetical protein